MNELVLMNNEELNDYYGGGVASMVAGATGKGSSIGKAAIAGASTGAYVGAGCPLP